MDKNLDLSSLNLAEKQLLSQAFETFNRSIEKLRTYQAKLQVQVQTLNEELRDKNQELTNVLQSLKSGLVVTDLKGRILTFNRAAVALTGIERETALGQELNGLLKLPLLPEPMDKAAFAKLSDEPKELRYRRADGGEILLEVTTTPMESEDKEAQGVILNLNDVSLLKRLQDEAQRKNRLTAMGEIAMQVAHEVRNPLGSIELFVSMMKKDFTEDSGEMELLNHITSAIHSMNHIISNLLEYSRPKPIQLEPMDLAPLVAEFVAFSQHTADQQAVEIDFEGPEPDLWVKGTPQLVKQVMLNIFMNACQAMDEGGQLSIRALAYEETDPLVLERFQKQVLKDRESLPVVRVSFKDTGRGMDEETLRRLFDPFFTTREQGTGLGMSIVHKTMTSHGGTIEVSSKLGEGTQIALLFPQHQGH
ncbi:MAG: ATP-binding protein [bacterium]|nr:ATP-binding protein [bacterium]